MVKSNYLLTLNINKKTILVDYNLYETYICYDDDECYLINLFYKKVYLIQKI